MVSICIPVYNWDVRLLIQSLEEQNRQFNPEGEIIIIDDGSDEVFRAVNREICGRHHYVELPENIGRARIRNLFLQYARFEYLLFLDCDSVLENDDFLNKYLDELNGEAVPDVLCGGPTYHAHKPSRQYMLRWKYGFKREKMPAEVRQKDPYTSFFPNNFLVRKEVLSRFPFDEGLTLYGHEDTLFAYELKKNAIPVLHIDNPVLNGQLDENFVFLKKTADAVDNLRKIQNNLKGDQGFIQSSKILRFYNKILPVSGFFAALFWLIRPVIVFLITKRVFSLVLFDFYKLGILLTNQKKIEN